MRKAESKLGVRYSLLLSLPYFDPVRYTVVDQMYISKLWVSMELFQQEELEKRIRSFIIPNSVGRLPINIMSNHGEYTASQWQSWILFYSAIIIVLKGLLPDQHWLVFVRACSILSERIVRKQGIVTADMLLLNFCQQLELLYGKDKCTPNLHLHLHIKECLLGYGPSHSFGAFPSNSIMAFWGPSIQI